jgi:Acyl-CoA reductase (LuxC)
MSDVITIPLIIRGQLIEDNLVEYRGRGNSTEFRTPDVNQYLNDIILRNPADIRDLYSLSIDEILEFLEELGNRLSPANNPYMKEALDLSVNVTGLSYDILNFLYEGQTRVARMEDLREMIDCTLGGSQYLDQWVSESRNDRQVKIRAFGSRMVHINPGTAPVIAFQSIINSAILRSDSIIKSPSNDPLTAAAIARTMIEMAPDHPITRHITVAYWKGGDREFEKRLYRDINLEKVIAWGGMASMNNIRDYLAPGIDLVALDPKSSCAVIGVDVFQSEETMRHAARLLAQDVGYLNQEACSCPRVGYVETGGEHENLEKLNVLGELVYQEMQRLPSNLSSNHYPHVNPVLRDEIAGMLTVPYFKVIGCLGNEGGVIVSQDDEMVDFVDYIGGRVINLVPVNQVEDALKYVTVHTQTIGIFPDGLKDRVRDECAWRGAQRLTSLGCATSASFSQPHDAIEPLRRMARWIVIEDFDVAKLGNSGILYKA